MPNTINHRVWQPVFPKARNCAAPSERSRSRISFTRTRKIVANWISYIYILYISHRPGVTNRSETKKHIYYYVTAKSHITRANRNITPSLPRSNTYLCSARFIVNTTYQYDNDSNVQSRVNVIACLCSCTNHKAHFHATRWLDPCAR